MGFVQEIKALFGSDAGRGVLGQRHINLAVDFGAAAAARVVLFTITGGEIYVRCLYCVATVAPNAGGGQTIGFDCTSGSTLSAMDTGAGTLGGLAIGAVIAPQGNILLPCVVAGPLTAGPTFSQPWICRTGTIGVTIGAALDHGDWDCIIFYVPLTSGATLT